MGKSIASSAQDRITSALIFQSQKNYKMQRRRIRRRRRFYNCNHLVKSRYGVHPAGYRVRRRRFNWRSNRNLRRELQVDQHLMAVIGVERATIGQIVRLTWDNNLQNPLNRRMIKQDQTLAAVIGAEEIHLLPNDEKSATAHCVSLDAI
jgi:chromatin remodeling complex protein RSC6